MYAADTQGRLMPGRTNGNGHADSAAVSDADEVTVLLRDAQRSLSRVLADRIADHGVSIGQWYFLRALWEEDGLTQRELSHRVGMMEPTTVTALNGMERSGLVNRVRNPRDRRKMNVFLTDRGRDLKDILMPVEAQVSRSALDGLGEAEAQKLVLALRQVAANLTGLRSAPLADH